MGVFVVGRWCPFPCPCRGGHCCCSCLAVARFAAWSGGDVRNDRCASVCSRLFGFDFCSNSKMLWQMFTVSWVVCVQSTCNLHCFRCICQRLRFAIAFPVQLVSFPPTFLVRLPSAHRFLYLRCDFFPWRLGNESVGRCLHPFVAITHEQQTRLTAATIVITTGSPSPPANLLLYHDDDSYSSTPYRRRWPRKPATATSRNSTPPC